MKSDKELIDEFHAMFGHSISTIKSYWSVFNNYCDFHAMNLSDLLAEAIIEQEKPCA